MKEILSRLDLLAAKIGQTAIVLWPHTVRHTAIEGFAAIAVWVLIATFAAALISVGTWFGYKNKWQENVWIAPLVAGAVLSLALIITLACSGADSIAQALEPTGYTVKAILKGAR